MGGFPTGWTGYAPLAIQAKQGQDAYLVAFGLMGISMVLAGFNIVATMVNYRAPGMTYSRLPLFVWAMTVTSMLMVLAAPILVVATYMSLLDRTVQTALFDVNHGGSSYLWQNLYWFFGHPEVYILALPGFGIALELLPVFARKPAFAYKTAVAGMVGVGVLSFFVWQHHLFDSGINPDMRPVVMFTTELISIPTGIIYLVAIGTMWRAKLRITVPMLFILGGLFNFLLGGISGVFLSDVPADGVAHGSFFVMAHFHYTIMGGYIFFFIAGIYYWVPKMLGRRLSDRIGKWHFGLMFIAFNSTFLPLFAVGQLGMPRRVFEYAQGPAGAQRLGLDLGVRPRAVPAGVRLQPAQVVDHRRQEADRGEPLAVEGPRVDDPDATAGGQLLGPSRWSCPAPTSTEPGPVRWPCSPQPPRPWLKEPRPDERPAKQRRGDRRRRHGSARAEGDPRGLLDRLAAVRRAVRDGLRRWGVRLLLPALAERQRAVARGQGSTPSGFISVPVLVLTLVGARPVPAEHPAAAARAGHREPTGGWLPGSRWGPSWPLR